MAGFDYTTVGPPTQPAPTAPASLYDKYNDVLYCSAPGTSTVPNRWSPINGFTGVNPQTGNYTTGPQDSGKLLAFSIANPSTLTLPATPPSTTWAEVVQNLGPASLTVNRNGKTINGSAANITLTSGNGLLIYTDGSNYFAVSGNGSGGGGGGATVEINGSVIANPNFNGTTPVAGAGTTNVVWQVDGLGNVSAAIGSIPESQVTNLTSDLALKAPLASPTLTGTPTAPTQTPLTNNTDIATTAYADAAVAVETTRAEAAEALLAPLASPALTGTPTAPTAALDTNTTQIATTAFVRAASGAVPVTSGLVGQYDFNQGAGTSLTDISGNGNNGTFGAGGAAPTWIANTGGLLFNGGQQVTLPSGITSSVKTIQIFCSVKSSSWNANGYNSPIISSTGNSGASGLGTGIILADKGIVSFGPLNAPHYFNVDTWSYPTGWQTESVGQFLGNGVVSVTFDTNDHIYINGTEDWYQQQQAVTAGSGVFQIGGGAINVGASVDTHFFGSIYYLALYNRVLTLAEINANTQFILQQMRNRGVSVAENDPSNTSIILTDGDSITSVNAYAQYLGASLATPPAWLTENKGRDGAQIVANLLPFGALDADPALPSGGSNVLVFWAGTNDLVIAGLTATQTLAGMAAYCTQRRQKGWKVIVSPMISRATSGDTDKNLFDPLVRGQWRSFADGLADVASDPRLGADGAYLNTAWFQVDEIHPTSAGQQNVSAPIIARAINRMFGNTDFSSATTYTTGAAAATTITAASESTNTVTFTFSATPANFVVGRPLAVTGVTPSGYNRTDYIILTRSGTQVTCFNPTSGLGAGSAFGSASVPQQVDADVCIILGGSSSSQNFTLETAIGYTGQRLQIKNTNTNSWTVTPWASETIDGASSITVATGATLILESTLVSSSAAGCNWTVIQNAV